MCRLFRNFENGRRCHGNGQNDKKLKNTKMIEFRAPANSSLQNTPRYQFALKSVTIDNLTILLAAILKMVAS
jgi:hypothetical protein